MWWENERYRVKPCDSQCHKNLIQFPRFQDITFTTKLLCCEEVKNKDYHMAGLLHQQKETHSLWSELSRNRHCKWNNFGGHESKTNCVSAALLSYPAQAEYVVRADKPQDLESGLFIAKNNLIIMYIWPIHFYSCSQLHSCSSYKTSPVCQLHNTGAPQTLNSPDSAAYMLRSFYSFGT